MPYIPSKSEPARMPRQKIVVVGDSGSGKSSLINMMVENMAAPVSDRAVGCTFDTRLYTDSRGNQFFDTVGLNERSKSSALDAEQRLTTFLASLSDGLHLIIFVHRKGRITETTVKNYKMFVRDICNRQVPVLLAISGCEQDYNEDDWYNENKHQFDVNKMIFHDVVSGCFTQSLNKFNAAVHSEMQECFLKTKEKMHTAISNEKYFIPHCFGNVDSWFSQVLQMIREVLVSYHTGSSQSGHNPGPSATNKSVTPVNTNDNGNNDKLVTLTMTKSRFDDLVKILEYIKTNAKDTNRDSDGFVFV